MRDRGRRRGRGEVEAVDEKDGGRRGGGAKREMGDEKVKGRKGMGRQKRDGGREREEGEGEGGCWWGMGEGCYYLVIASISASNYKPPAKEDFSRTPRLELKRRPSR